MPLEIEDEQKQLAKEGFMSELLEEEKQEEKKEEIKQEEKKEDEPSFKRIAKAKPDKDESINTLKNNYTQLKKDYDELKGLLGTDIKPEVFKPLLELVIEKAGGPVTMEFVQEFIEDNKRSGETLKQMQERLAANEAKVKELDIRHSEEFKEKYQLPYEQRAKDLFLEFAQIADDKTIIAPKATAAFNAFLVNNVDTLDGIEVKAELNKFLKAYKEESGEEITMPPIKNIMDSLRAFKGAKGAMHEAFNNWTEAKKQNQEELTRKQIEDRERSLKTTRKIRVEAVSKALQQFDNTTFDFVKDEDLETIFKEEFELGEKLVKGEDVPEYHELVTRGAKSRLWDQWAPEIKIMREKLAKYEKGDRNHLDGSDDINFKAGQKDEGDPEAFLGKR